MSKKVTRLFEQFQPENYKLHIKPNADNLTFTGTVTIVGKKTGRPSERLTFHQKGLKITDASITKNAKLDRSTEGQEVEIERINTHESSNEVRLHTKETLYAGDYWVVIEFEGKITDHMLGIYPCHFKHDGQDKMLIATQFESHHAREAFPCIDEPEAKATFDFVLTTPKDHTALSNTPIVSETIEDDTKETIFETTPRMSTYLLAFVCGELGYKEAKTKDGVVIRTYATPDNVELTDLSLDVAVRCLEFFGDYFGTPYPLPKLDMVALPDFASGAMENWGLVTYREVYMLADEKASSIETKQHIALVVCHELTHQWFGNLVTMKWWDDLWLNESFANMLEYRAVDALYPEWNIWEQFVSHEGVSAKRRDSLTTVQSVHTEVKHPDEIHTLFDPAIVYAKGGTILYMLFNYIGEQNFKNGLTAYFKKHAYGNTVANDLWEALSEASGQDVGAFMQKWLVSPGVPLVTVDWKPSDKDLELTQRRFLADPAAENTDNTPWQIPLTSTLAINQPSLAKSSAKLEVESAGDEPLLLGHDGKSYLIPYYANPAHLSAITDAIESGKVSSLDRFLLLDNYNLLQRGGISQTTELLDLLSAYSKESNETVWGAIAMSIAEGKKLVENSEARCDQLNAMVASLVANTASALGWDDSPEDSAQELRLRASIISLAAGAKVKSVIDEGLQRFRAFEKPADLPASTRTTIYFCGIRFGNDDDFAKLLDLYKTSQSAEEKDDIAAGLTSSRNPEHLKQLIELLKSDHIRRQDLMHWYVWLVRNYHARNMAWDWLVSNWDWIVDQFSKDKSFGYFARYCGSIFSTPVELEQFNNFFEDKKPIVTMARDIGLAQQEIQARVAWRERNQKAVEAWLDSHWPKETVSLK